MWLTELCKTDFEEAWRILEESFPPEERRTKEGQRELMDREAYRLYGCRKDGALLGILAVWKFETFTFLEHFAVKKTARGGGLGEKLLKEFLAGCDRTVLLEVEPPEGEIERRRIAFYERNGFVVNRYEYVQPPLQPGCAPIPLRLMTLAQPVPEPELDRIRDTLYREVYSLSGQESICAGGKTK